MCTRQINHLYQGKASTHRRKARSQWHEGYKKMKMRAQENTTTPPGTLVQLTRNRPPDLHSEPLI